MANRIDWKEVVEELVDLKELIASLEVDSINDQDNEWLEDRSKPEEDVDDELPKLWLIKMRVLKWLNEMMSDAKMFHLTNHDANRESMKTLRIKLVILLGRPELPLFILAPKLKLKSETQSPMKSMENSVRLVGVRHWKINP